MKLGTWLAMLGTVGCAGASLVALGVSQGCTATLTAGTDDGGFDDNGSSGGSSSSGSSSGSTEDAGPATQIDAGNAPLDPCTSCEYGICAGAYTICIQDPGCAAILQCAGACPSSDVLPDGGDCAAGCGAQNDPNATPTPSQALYNGIGNCDFAGACNGGSCASTCNLPSSYCNPQTSDDAGSEDAGGGVVDSGTGTDAAVSCPTCQQNSCGSQLAACGPNTACGTYNQCVMGCTTSDCATACQTDNPSGYNAAQALGTCTSTSCPQCSQ